MDIRISTLLGSFLALERSVYYSITCGINLLNQFNETLACEPLYTNESKTEIVMHKSGINKKKDIMQMETW